MTIQHLFIANRGELALRVLRTAHKMGIETVLGFSEADAASLPARLAGRAVVLGPGPSAQNYLAIDRVVAAARETGCDAVHPGYGFVSENAAFARAVAAAGMVFVGPAVTTLEGMGDKLAARALALAAGLPVLPGGEAETAAAVAERVRQTGYPLLLKAVAGGGGKGIRRVDRTQDLDAALAMARAEAQAAMPSTPLQFITTGLRFIAWQQADPEFMRLVYRTLQTNGVGRFVLLDPMHEVPAAIEAARLVKQEGGAQVMAALTFTLSAIHTDGFYADFTRVLAQCPDIDLFYITDPGGLLSVDRVGMLVPAVKAVIGAKPLEIHAHTAIGQGMLTILEAARLGISAIHVGIGPGGDGSSLPERTAWSPTCNRPGTRWTSTRRAGAANRLLAAGRAGRGTATGRAAEFRCQFTAPPDRRRGDDHPCAPTRRNRPGPRRAWLSDHGHAVSADGHESGAVKLIGTHRYAQVSDQVIRYCRGKFGKPTSPIDPTVLATIMDRPRARELEAEPTFPALADLRRQFGHGLPDEEFLLRAVIPGDQVSMPCSPR